MGSTRFRTLIVVVALAFTGMLLTLVGGPLWESRDIINAFLGGGVTRATNPFAVAYIIDVWVTWTVLAIWVTRERRPWGWVALVLGLVPGVAVGLAAYLLIRERPCEQR